MPTQNQDLRYRLLGQDVSAGRTFSKFANDAKAAHSAVSELGNALSSTGAFTPLTQGLDAISAGFQHIQENGKSARVVMQGVGVGIAAAGAALLGLGANAQQASAGLKQAIQDAGGVSGEYAKQIDATVAKTATFGRTAGDTENALARLTTATQDPQKALSLMGLTADIAAAKQMNLTDSAQLLTTALAGNTRVFRQFGINVGAGKLSADQLNRALDELSRRLSGRAQAQADTFSGRIKAVGVELENAADSLTKFAPLLLTMGAGLTIASAAWDLLAKAKARNAAADVANIASSQRVAAAEVEAGTAAAVSGGGFGGIGAGLTRGNFLKAGGFAVGGLVAGQIAGAAFGGGQTGSAVGDALTGAGAGAGIGTLIEPGLGTLIGAGVGAAGGALLGLFHHGAPPGKLTPQQRQLVTAQQQQASSAMWDQFLPGELDALGNPKAAKVAAATDALANAKTKLSRAQDDLNKLQAKGEDPLKITAATEHLTAAEANLRKAEYLGGTARIASAQATVDQAQAALNALHAGRDLTGAERRVTDARAGVRRAQTRLSAARTAITGLSAGQVLGRLTGNVHTEEGMAADAATLVDKFGIAQPVLAQIEALNSQIPGTLHRVARTMTRALAEKLNNDQTGWDRAKQAFEDAGNRALGSAAAALGKQLADDQMRAYQKRMRQYGVPQTANLGAPFQSPRTGGPSALSGLLGAGLQGNTIVTGPVTVQANDPEELGRAMAARNRMKALSGSGRQGTAL